MMFRFGSPKRPWLFSHWVPVWILGFSHKNWFIGIQKVEKYETMRERMYNNELKGLGL